MRSDEAILQERALSVSGKQPDRDEFQEGEIKVIEFLLSPERYAIEECYVAEVLLLKELTPIPGVPPFVAGITNIRGRIISVINLKIFLGISTKGITELNRIIVLKNKTMEFGILTDSILGSKNIAWEVFASTPLTLQKDAAGYLKGITAEGLILIDGERLLNASRIVVNMKNK